MKLGWATSIFSEKYDRGVDSLAKSYLKNPKAHLAQNDRAHVSTMYQQIIVMHPGDEDLITAQSAYRNKNDSL